MSLLSKLLTPVAWASTRVTEAWHVASSKARTAFTIAATVAAGMFVTERTALGISGVWCAVRVLSETVAGLPLHLYRREEDGTKTRVRDHPVARLLLNRPNPATSWYVFKETLQAHLSTWGNAYAFIERNNGGDPIGLWQLTPDRVRVELKDGDDLPTYVVDGKERLGYLEMLHIPALGFDGLTGYSPIAVARQTLGLAAAYEQYAGTWFGNGARPSGTLNHPKKLGDKARESLKEEWNRLHGGGNSNKVAVLCEGMEFKPFTVPPDEAQFIESRKFTLAEIARIFNMPPHMLKDLDRSTNNNIEQQAREFLMYSILPWLNRWIEELQYKLLHPDEQEVYYFKHRVDFLLRADIAARYAAYAIGRQWGWLSVNKILELEDMDPIGDEGDVYLQPMNMVPAANGGWQPIAWSPSKSPAAKPEGIDPFIERITQ